MFILQALGIQASAIPPPNYAAGFLIGNFIFSYMASNTRWPKMYYGIDHNANPRQDMEKYAEVMVKEGKMTRKNIDMLRRQEAAHQNNVEGFPVFVGTLLFALQAGLPSTIVNRFAAFYTLSRLGYTLAYAVTESENASFVRSGLWLAGNFSCIWTLVLCGKEINRPIAMFGA